MRRSTCRFVLATLLFTFLATLFSCMGEPPPEQSLEWLLRQGRASLENEEGSVAYNFFREAVDRFPESTEAHYGIVLSLNDRVFANIDGIIDLLAGVYIFQPSSDDCAEACARLTECDLLDEAWTDEANCIRDCPWRLWKWMFYYVIEGDHTCHEIRREAMEWLIPPSPKDCRLLCEDLDYCGLIQPPLTFNVEECVAYCPNMWVERHTRCYLGNLGSCNGHDRTCFNHITKGVQILFREIGVHIPPQIIDYSDVLLERGNDFQYFLDHYKWTLVDPPIEIELDGRYDHGFVHLSRVLGYSFHAFLLMTTAVELELNVENLDLLFRYPKPQGALPIVWAIRNSLEIILYDPVYALATRITNEPWAYEQIREGGQALGRAAGSVAEMFGFMLGDRDRQKGKALAYDDANGNFVWDADETMTIRGIDLEFTREQATVLIQVCRALEANLLEREPIDLELLYPLLEAFDADSLTWLADLGIAWSDGGTLDLSEMFYNPQRDSFRDLLAVVVAKLRIIENILRDADV